LVANENEWDDSLVELSGKIVSAYVTRNAISADELPDLIASVFTALEGCSRPTVTTFAAGPTPAVSIRRSLTPDYLICLDDGRRFKSLRRHLADLGMTPEQYRKKWGLPPDYPMVAPNYSAKRSALAKTFGLGKDRARKARTPKPAAVAKITSA
jgi:predicted transcriptional regulator